MNINPLFPFTVHASCKQRSCMDWNLWIINLNRVNPNIDNHKLLTVIKHIKWNE